MTMTAVVQGPTAAAFTASAVELRMPALQPAADAAPVRAEWSGKLPTDRPNADVAAAQSARVRCNLWLTTCQWRGEVQDAVAIVNELVRNAVLYGSTEHGQDVTLRFVLTQAGALLIEVKDGLPGFPAFDTAGALRGSGLNRVRRRGAELTWFPTKDGKTVQARLTPPGMSS
ncbi:ATP-binding protein [Streptomyces sp. NPDC056465]|uniref:ATP-binding protein n=1 Tax=Streptomyces sp. NPDC056465 TaxID=3345829 RepID=UPI0036BC12E5